MQGLSNNIIELQLYSNQHLTTCILTFEEYASFHRHVRDVEDVCPSLTAHSILSSSMQSYSHYVETGKEAKTRAPNNKHVAKTQKVNKLHDFHNKNTVINSC